MTEIKQLYSLLKNNEAFAFNRFSDGEYYIINNQYLEIAHKKVKVGQNHVNNSYAKFDFKVFDPLKHQANRDRLIQAFTFNQKNYFKGFMCKCCTSRHNYKNQFKLLTKYNGKRSDFDLSSNLLINGNYLKFRKEILPLILSKDYVIVAHQSASLRKFRPIKAFKLGYNSFIEEMHKIQEIANWIEANKISNTIFLLSGSSWAKVAIHELYLKFPQNTYIDIGTALNHDFEMPTNRGYLNEYYGKGIKDINRLCSI